MLAKKERRRRRRESSGLPSGSRRSVFADVNSLGLGVLTNSEVELVDVSNVNLGSSSLATRSNGLD